VSVGFLGLRQPKHLVRNTLTGRANDELLVTRQKYSCISDAEIGKLSRRPVPVFEMTPFDNADDKRCIGGLVRLSDVARKGTVPGLLCADEAIELRIGSRCRLAIRSRPTCQIKQEVPVGVGRRFPAKRYLDPQRE
jgi:hypothetical protein